ncbi:MAG: trypsin-like peptidase domain-containing protein [Patescibacteria group bacterium]|nr:trypsin-like peptidase domain-containing protein [Patescibacteria group bacterium]
MQIIWQNIRTRLPTLSSPLGAGFLALLIMAIGGYSLLQSQLLEQQQSTRYLVAVQQEQITALNGNISSLRDQLGIAQKNTEEQTAALTKELQQTQSQQQTATSQTQQKLSAIEQGISAIKPYDTTKIVSEWRPRIAYVECQWQDALGNPYEIQSGSGILTTRTDGEPEVVTNAHVLLDPSNAQPTVCGVQFPDYGKTITTYPNAFSFSGAGYDWARINLTGTDGTIHALAQTKLATCSQTPSVGTNIVVLGYPGIGSQTDVTATEGIISGYDGNYYITSAKVEHGNSGGAAIMLANDCYLGIPTFVESGSIESLARILKSQLIFPAAQ